jgi:hypothetical protein
MFVTSNNRTPGPKIAVTLMLGLIVATQQPFSSKRTPARRSVLGDSSLGAPEEEEDESDVEELLVLLELDEADEDKMTTGASTGRARLTPARRRID